MYLEDSGFWRQENEWPLARTVYTPMYLSAGGRLSREADSSTTDGHDDYAYNPAAGVMAGIHARGGVAPWAMPLDQRLDEAYSLTYTTEPLKQDLEITGDSSAKLYVSSSADTAYFEVKVCDVAPDGTSKMVTDGGLNAAQRDSRINPEPLTPGQVYELTIPLKSMAYVFPGGHQIRMDISSADFQNAWLTAQRAVNSIHWGRKYRSEIIFPVAPPQNPSLPLPELISSPHHLPELSEVPKPIYTVSYDLVNETTTVTQISPGSGGLGGGENHVTFTVNNNNSADAVLKSTYEYVVSQPGAEIKMDAQCVTTSDATSYHHVAEVEITVNGLRHFNRSWSVSVPRKLN